LTQRHVTRKTNVSKLEREIFICQQTYNSKQLMEQNVWDVVPSEQYPDRVNDTDFWDVVPSEQ